MNSRVHRHAVEARQVLECASPLALWAGRACRGEALFCAGLPSSESGRGLPQSKTLRVFQDALNVRPFSGAFSERVVST